MPQFPAGYTQADPIVDHWPDYYARTNANLNLGILGPDDSLLERQAQPHYAPSIYLVANPSPTDHFSTIPHPAPAGPNRFVVASSNHPSDQFVAPPSSYTLSDIPWN